MADSSAKLGWKVYAGLAGAAGAYAARKALTLVWEKATGKTPPANPEHPDVTWAEAAGWAVVSGVAVALARLAATRQAARVWHRASGSLPPGLEETG